MRAICEDFCRWMYNRGQSQVKVTQVMKAQPIRKDLIMYRERRINTDSNETYDGEINVDVGF